MFYPKSPFLGQPLLESEILKVNTSILPQLLEWLCQTPRITTYRVNLLRTSFKDYHTKIEQKLRLRYGSLAPRVYGLPQLPEILCIDPLRATEEADACQPSPHRRQIIVDTSCGSALLRGAHVYAPGVLAMETGTQLKDRVDVYADLAGKCKKGTATRYECPQKIYIGVGEVLMQRFQLYNNQEQSPQGIAIEMQQTVSSVPCLGDLSDGEGLLQNLPSMVCVRVLDPQPGERILDMCAAPGNKTSHIAQLMKDQGSLVALDNSRRRLQDMQNRLKAYQCVESYVYDSTKALRRNDDEEGKTGPPFPLSSFDRILLDAPCSGLGNRPQLCCPLKQPKDLQSYPKIQRRLFEQAAQLLRPGGTLVYSTCTVTEAECEEVVCWALQKFPELQLLDATPRLGGPGLPLKDLDADKSNFLQRFGPGNTWDSVGFFIAKFGKLDCKQN